MPKAAPSTSTATRSSGAPFQSAQVLRRNQACHQCRRRKLVTLFVYSDAKRPCSTCVRSHAYSVAHAPPGTELPPHPECTFDEVSESTIPDSEDSPKNRFERLENKINELEALLREKDQSSPSDDSSPSRTRSAASSYESSSLIMSYPDSLNIDPTLNGAVIDMTGFSTTPGLDDLAGVSAFVGTPFQMSFDDNISQNNMAQSQEKTYPRPEDYGEMLNPSWPKGLPNHSTLRYLVEAFFTNTPLADRMFHSRTFLASLELPSTHSKFPLPAILHAMCALGSMYTASAAPSSHGLSTACSQTVSFAELQIQAARLGLEYSLRTTSNLFGALQAQVLVALWYWYNARWSEACVAFSISLRLAVPCGLNVCPPFESISNSNMARSSIIPASSNPLEDETRRNTFWIAYMMERHFGAINNFAMFLDDEDVCQMLPVRAEQFEQGILVPSDNRQWSHEPGIVHEHMDEQIDSFGLHVKASMILSKVKLFNSRYKMRRHRGDPALEPDPAGLPGMPRPDLIQSTPAFVEIDNSIKSFLASLPSHLKDPFADGAIDVSLLTAISSAHFATIILHEGHANIGRPTCISSCRVLTASRAILNLLYRAYSTSHNLALTGVFPMVCWFAAGRVLVRFLRSAIEAKSDEHITALQAEVDFISRGVISSIGESVPHARQYGKMLNDYLIQTCGKEYAKPATVCPPPRSSGESHQLEGHGFQEDDMEAPRRV
ncbi:hypothetical protein BD309DRAFT_860573 [Dichomitus squalens]|nr:hypothetical protein BD309DRAFT_860573 [Dichomitus squalens]